MKFSISLCITILLLSVAIVSAQEKGVTAETLFATSSPPATVNLPLPKYPSEANNIGLGGRVTVAVSVDVSGMVTVLDDGDGPYPVCKSVTNPNVLAMRRAAVEAAKKARFKPADGAQPAAITGRLIYIFTSDQRIQATRVSGQGIVLVTKNDTSGVTTSGPDEARMNKANGASTSKTISGGVLNGKALALPVPAYPAAAKAVRASGAVSVQVLIVEDGTVYSAEAVSGHPLLRRASEIVACKSSFTPTLLEGQPVKVSGIITYNYNL